MSMFNIFNVSGSARGLGVNGATPSGAIIVASCQNGAVAGNFQLQWAENTANGTGTILKATSGAWALRGA